jgi:hypothetical protein
MTSSASNSRFTRAMSDLQADFKILPVAVTQAGAWRYAFAYDVVARHYPELPERARFISDGEARRELVKKYFLSVGAAQMRDVSKLFQWKSNTLVKTIDDLVASDILVREQESANNADRWLVLADLV